MDVNDSCIIACKLTKEEIKMTSQKYFDIVDQHFKPTDNLQSFAYTNTILNLLPTISRPVLHFWTLENTVILGLKDQRLPHLDSALQLIHSKNYHYFVRNSGGLAVISDAGVLNVSLFLPNGSDELSVDQGYQQMTDLIQSSFPTLNIEAREIPHSYCPGKFDLAVNGVKIGGMSQRRNQTGVVIMLYISVNGPQISRSSLIRDFYLKGLSNEKNTWNFPDVWPSSMTTISELSNDLITVETVKKIISKQLSSMSGRRMITFNFNKTNNSFKDALNDQIHKMQIRQQKLTTFN